MRNFKKGGNLSHCDVRGRRTGKLMKTEGRGGSRIERPTGTIPRLKRAISRGPLK